MNKYIYLVHTEVSEYNLCELMNTVKHKVAFTLEEKAIKYIEDEIELFKKENPGTNNQFFSDPGYFGTAYIDEKKIIMVKMWYERVTLV